MGRTTLYNCIFIFLVSSTIGSAQSYSDLITTSTEQSADSTIFQHCLDSISKYVYLDSKKIKPYQQVCEDMLSNNALLTNRHRLEYVIQSIYNEYNYNNAIGVAKIIEEHRYMLDLDGIPFSQRNQFIYLDGYTKLITGAVEDAQTVFYEMLEDAEAKRDTTRMIQAYSGLGKLFVYQKDYEKAAQYFLAEHKATPSNRPFFKTKSYIELIKLYIASEQFEKAAYYNTIGLRQADSLKALDLKLDFLLHEIDINIAKNDIKSAKIAHKEAVEIGNEKDNHFYKNLCYIFSGKLFLAQKQYDDALKIFDDLIQNSKEKGEVPSDLLGHYKMAIKAAEGKGDFEKSYRYLIKANEIQDSLSIAEHRQKSQYLQLKFDAHQKEKENALLTSQILQKDSQNKLLYALIAVFITGIVFLVAAFIQKREYNKRLEEEVNTRTKDLKNANEELNEFNNILSHDLKEPLRSIISFTAMATKALDETDPKNKYPIEYLNYVNNSGKQMHQLIVDVSDFQSIDKPSFKKMELINVNNCIQSIITSHQYSIQDKNATIKVDELPNIYSSPTLLFIVFKNLIENGIKFNESDQPTLQISYQASNEFHHFLIKDNGIGIAPAFHERIFGMFKRLHKRGTYTGSGLGLNTVKKILARIEGNIQLLESEEGKGSTFQVSLPIVNPSDL